VLGGGKGKKAKCSASAVTHQKGAKPSKCVREKRRRRRRRLC